MLSYCKAWSLMLLISTLRSDDDGTKVIAGSVAGEGPRSEIGLSRREKMTSRNHPSKPLRTLKEEHPGYKDFAAAKAAKAAAAVVKGSKRDTQRSLGLSLPCDSSELEATVELETDTFPEDTSWRIFDLNTLDTVVDSTDFVPDGYVGRYEEYFEHTFCLPSDTCMVFQMLDSFGDGFRMSYGSDTNPGGYNFTVDGVLYGDSVTEKFQFVYSATTEEFGNNCGMPCEEDELTVVVDLMSDLRPKETSWGIIESGGEEYVSSTDFYPFFYNYREFFTHKICVPSDDCFRFGKLE